jgi:hypothetical protein
MLTWLNLDSNKVHYTGCLKLCYVMYPAHRSLSVACQPG